MKTTVLASLTHIMSGLWSTTHCPSNCKDHQS